MATTLVDMGTQDRRRDRDADFSAYMAARQPALYRTAYLLAGDHAGAEDLLQNAFAKLYLSWDKVRDREALDGYVRRIMVNENNSLWRRAWKRREHATDTMPETGVLDTYDDGMGGVLCCSSRPCRRSSARWWCFATTSSSARPRSPTCSASPSAP